MEALQHDWPTAIGVHTSDLLGTPGAPGSAAADSAAPPTSFKGRLGNLTRERRAAPNRELQALLGLPKDEVTSRARGDVTPGRDALRCLRRRAPP
jgi:hypothetical protein